MMFDTAVELILKHEGGWVQDENDPGGETNYGISKRAYPDLNIKELTRDDAKQIYRRDYWDAIRADEMPEPVAVAVFDMAVNAGVRTAIRLLQRVVRVTDDGIIGPVTLAAVNSAEPHEIALRYAAERISYYAALRGWDRYGRGWTRRVIETTLEGLK
jgi:lysozyme family protein